MSLNKASGPDGITIEFIRKFWPKLYKDFHKIMADFHSNGTIPNGLNSSFITLIPKTKQPKLVTDFRPISLINCSLKILLKVMANRLRKVIPNIVLEEQSSFMKGRNITDSVLITIEVAHSLQTKAVEGFILKLDFEKAFNSVNWEFLIHSMEQIGFGDRWNNWILSILKSMSLYW